MLQRSRVRPATLWRAFFVLACAAATVFAGAPPSRPPELAQVGKPNEAETEAMIQQVREAGIPGQFYLQFELRTLPRRGPEKTFRGHLWGGHHEQGQITRIELTDAEGTSHRFLIQNGPEAKVWRAGPSGAVRVEGADLLAPLIPGVEVSAFDVQMPFLYWPGGSVEKITRVFGGRPGYAVVFPAPAAFTAAHPRVGAVRAYLDTQYKAIMQTEVLGRDGGVTKTFTLLSLKRVGEQPLPKQADYRNEATRDKTRLQVTGAALNLRLAPSVFDPASLGQPVPPPPGAQIVRID